MDGGDGSLLEILNVARLRSGFSVRWSGNTGGCGK